MAIISILCLNSPYIVDLTIVINSHNIGIISLIYARYIA